MQQIDFPFFLTHREFTIFFVQLSKIDGAYCASEDVEDGVIVTLVGGADRMTVQNFLDVDDLQWIGDTEDPKHPNHA